MNGLPTRYSPFTGTNFFGKRFEPRFGFADEFAGLATPLKSDGTGVQGFLVEAAAVDGARDISRFGGWRAFMAEAAETA